MDNNEYLDFDEAVAFLKTTPSTLYKWLQGGKIPGHKLGRQWRFLRDELEIHVSGKASRINVQKDFLHLSEVLNDRRKNKKESSMQMDIQQLTEQIIWDAFDHKARLVHIYPSKGKFEISYRSHRDGLDKLTSIQEDFFNELDGSLRSWSVPVGQENSRRLFLSREQGEELQIRYQKIDTVTGPRLTLRIWQPENDVLPFERIHGGDEKALETFKKWAKIPHGIILISGVPGSGKTTTVYSLLNELKNQGRIVFTIEETVEMVIDGVNQVEMKSRKREDFEEMFDQVMSSDPDVICLGLATNFHGNEDAVFAAAYEAASTGHLVVLQMSEASAEEAHAFLKKHTKHNVDPLIVGVSSQVLVATDKGRKAQYSFL